MPKAKNSTFIFVSMPNRAMKMPMVAVKGRYRAALMSRSESARKMGSRPIAMPRGSARPTASKYPRKLILMEYSAFTMSASW